MLVNRQLLAKMNTYSISPTVGECPAINVGDVGESPTVGVYPTINVGEYQTIVYQLQLTDVRFCLENGDSNARIHTIRNSSVNYYP